MSFIRSPKFLIFLIVFVNFLGYGIVFPILPLMTEKYGGDPITSGVLIAIFSLMQVISMPILGRLSDRYGRRPLLIFSLWGTVLSFAIMGFTHSILWLLIARIIDGISGGNLSIAQAYIADITDKKDRAGGMGIIAAGISLGFILGPLWGGLFGRISLSAPFFAAAIITFISVFLTQFFLKETITPKEVQYERSHGSFKVLLKEMANISLLGMFISYMLLFWAQSGIFTTLSLFANDILHLGVAGVGLVFAFGGTLSAIIQGFAINRAVKIVPERKIYIYSSLVSVLGFIIMSQGASVLIFFIGITIFSVGNSFLAPVIQSLASESSSPHEQGATMGLLQSFGSIGRIFGPIVAGFIYEKVNPFSPSLMGAIIVVIIFLIGLKLFSTKSLTLKPVS